MESHDHPDSEKSYERKIRAWNRKYIPIYRNIYMHNHCLNWSDSKFKQSNSRNSSYLLSVCSLASYFLCFAKITELFRLESQPGVKRSSFINLYHERNIYLLPIAIILTKLDTVQNCAYIGCVISPAAILELETDRCLAKANKGQQNYARFYNSVTSIYSFF